MTTRAYEFVIDDLFGCRLCNKRNFYCEHTCSFSDAIPSKRIENLTVLRSVCYRYHHHLLNEINIHLVRFAFISSYACSKDDNFKIILHEILIHRETFIEQNRQCSAVYIYSDKDSQNCRSLIQAVPSFLFVLHRHHLGLLLFFFRLCQFESKCVVNHFQR